MANEKRPLGLVSVDSGIADGMTVAKIQRATENLRNYREPFAAAARPRRFDGIRRRIYRLVYWTILPKFNPILLRVVHATRRHVEHPQFNRFLAGVHELAWGLVCGDTFTGALRVAWIYWRPGPR